MAKAVLRTETKMALQHDHFDKASLSILVYYGPKFEPKFGHRVAPRVVWFAVTSLA